MKRSHSKEEQARRVVTDGTQRRKYGVHGSDEESVI